MDMKEEDIDKLKSLLDSELANLEQLDKTIRDLGLQNEQFILDFYDNLNEISVRN